MAIILNGTTGITTPAVSSTGGVGVGSVVTFPDNSTQATAATGFGFKNRIINGAMMIDQRNAGASITANDGTFVVDRFGNAMSQASKFTAQRNQGSVTPPAGFTNYLGYTSSSAYSITSTDFFTPFQIIEGFNVADFGWGTANAQTVTVSFWVRSSLTGTFGGSLSNAGLTRSYPFTYTISSANTWEQKSVTIAGDTSGTWATDNTQGIRLYFGLGVGSTYSGTAGAWAGTRYQSATGATSVVGTNGATFYITGVQLEKGSTATSFDYRPITTEFQLCSRYFQIYGGQGGSPNFQSYGSGDMNTVYPLPVEMRVTPTGTTSGTWAKSNCGDPTMVHAGTTAITVRVAVTSLGKFEVYPSGGSGKITLSSEL
jgi:hypothetical protein